MKIVSACLAGMHTRFDGTASPCQKIIDMVSEGSAIPLCPEQLGGLPTPRPAAERVGASVLTQNGENVTNAFRHGAEEALQIALLVDCDEAILKSDSPSCGCGRIHDGNFSGGYVYHDGVFAELLKQHGIRIRTEHEI